MYLYDYLTEQEKEQFQELHGLEFKEFRETMAKKYGKELQDALHQLPPELFELIKETAKTANRVSDMLTETGDAFCNDAITLLRKSHRLQNAIKGELQ
jgi:putative heme iron utilization protein